MSKKKSGEARLLREAGLSRQIVVGLEPELFGDYVLFIGITRPDFNHDRLQTGCFPIADLETPTPSTLL